jgi:hypothetical protein
MNWFVSFVRVCRAPTLAVSLLAACYSQVPLTMTTPTAATRIIAVVTDSGTVAMANAIGPGAQEIEGIVSSADPQAWSLSLLRVDHRGGTSVFWNRELVTFPRYTLTNPTVKRLDKTRSWMAGTLIAAGAFLAAKAFSNIGADNNVIVNPPPPAIRLP